MSGAVMLDGVLIVLLAATLLQAVRLERNLGTLRRNQAELQRIISGFDDATRHAEAGLDRLHDAAGVAGRKLAQQTERGAALQQDLEFLTARGDKLADRLEVLVRVARGQAETPAAAAPAAATASATAGGRDLLRILQAQR
jgi:uncharacterized membrane protein YccC